MYQLCMSGAMTWLFFESKLSLARHHRHLIQRGTHMSQIRKSHEGYYGQADLLSHDMVITVGNQKKAGRKRNRIVVERQRLKPTSERAAAVVRYVFSRSEHCEKHLMLPQNS